MDEEAFGALIDAYERLRAQVTDLTRLAGCAAVGKEFREIKPMPSWRDIPPILRTGYLIIDYKDQNHD